MELPYYRYHPDPVATGSIEARSIQCVCCGERRPFVYTGAVYSEHDLNDSLCPWCIASGLAFTRYGAEFSDSIYLDGFTRRLTAG